MNTKKIIFLLSLLAVAFLSSAQSSDASRIAYGSLNFSQTNPVLGTARYSGMGGAMGALGGDASTMKDNPAGLGVYRSSDITLTPNVFIANDNSVGFNINNFGLVLNFQNSGNRTGYITSSFGVSYNRLKNFRRNTDEMDSPRFSMTDNMGYAPGYLSRAAESVGLIDDEGSLFAFNPKTGKYQDIDNRIRYIENGSIGEWNFSYGANISNRFYLGMSLGFVDLDYRQSAMYDEQSIDARDAWYLDNYYEVTGGGFNFKFGAIAAITDFMRIGVAFHTPTFYNIDEYIREEIGYDLIDNVNKSENFYKMEDFYNSDLQTPLRLQGSLGFIIEKIALIGLEYQFEDFSAMRFSSRGILHESSKEIINGEMKASHTVKAGVEVNAVDGLSFRAGIAFVSSPSIKLMERVYSDPEFFQSYPLAQPQSEFYYTGGIGYKKEFFYANLAYVHQVRNEKFFEYLPQADGPYNLSLHNNNIMATLGFRF
jgi:hypothetical protein